MVIIGLSNIVMVKFILIYILMMVIIFGCCLLWFRLEVSVNNVLVIVFIFCNVCFNVIICIDLVVVVIIELSVNI